MPAAVTERVVVLPLVTGTDAGWVAIEAATASGGATTMVKVPVVDLPVLLEFSQALMVMEYGPCVPAAGVPEM